MRTTRAILIVALGVCLVPALPGPLGAELGEDLAMELRDAARGGDSPGEDD